MMSKAELIDYYISKHGHVVPEDIFEAIVKGEITTKEGVDHAAN